MWKWIKEHGFKTALLMMLGYLAHLFIEAFIVTNIMALAGIKMPVLAKS